MRLGVTVYSSAGSLPPLLTHVGNVEGSSFCLLSKWVSGVGEAYSPQEDFGLKATCR